MRKLFVHRRSISGMALIFGFATLCASAAKAAAADDHVKDLYSTYCASCHGVKNTGAPEAFSASAWKPRVSKGANVLLTNAIKGVGNMPPQGTCFECTQADLRQLIQYMSGAK